MFELDFSRWQAANYTLQQDEIITIVELLNSINTAISGSTLVVPDSHVHASKQLAELDWTRTDDIPVALSGEVSLSAYIFLIAK